MIPRTLAAYRLALALGVVCWPMGGWAQGESASQEDLWRQANAAVAQFPRGHADVLKWEQSNPTAEDAGTAQAGAFTVAQAEDAVRLAWSLHPDLKTTMARMAPATLAAVAAGNWDTLDPSLVRRVEGMNELLGVAVQARKDFAHAVAAQAAFQQAKEQLHSAESARALGERMVRVGNWSKLQQVPLQLAHAAAQMHVQKTQLAWVQAQGSLLKTLGQAGVYTAIAVPASLQPLPQTVWTEQEVQAKASALQEQLYFAERRMHRDLVVQAYAAYRGAHAHAKLAQEVLQLHQFTLDELVLHYNGMLKSTWDVLAQAQSQMQAATAAVNAQRDFAIAQMDLQWVLLGGEPKAFVSLGGAESAPAAAGH